jgi:signal transduction histidine kinase
MTVLSTEDDALTIRGDRLRLARVLHNLFGNAIKYSPQKTPVDVTVQRDGDTALIAVRDQGVGIPSDELPRIFTRFFRASTAAGISGTGIGLAGSKAVIEQHGGAIMLESSVGVGTTVSIRLPLAPPLSCA